MLVERQGNGGSTRVLIDTSPDLREQLLDLDVGDIDGVLYTHEHADHVHGIDELRVVALNMRKRVPVWANDRTGTMLLGRFGYCFYSPPTSDYPPILNLNRISPNEAVVITGGGGDIEAMPFELEHGTIRALGFRIEGVAYTPDLSAIPDTSVHHLEGLDLWIIDALRPSPHPSHFSLDEALEWIARVKPRKAILTNLHVDQDYETLRSTLPVGVVPAYDGMVINLAR